jgi:pilus assembly protein CpaE
LALPSGTAQARRAVLVLNRLGMPGGLNKRQVEEALRMSVDVTFPDLPKLLCAAENLGEPAVKQRSGFRTGIFDLAKEVAFAPSAVPAKSRRMPWSRR